MDFRQVRKVLDFLGIDYQLDTKTIDIMPFDDIETYYIENGLVFSNEEGLIMEEIRQKRKEIKDLQEKLRKVKKV